MRAIRGGRILPSTAEEIIETLALAPHPEGGYYRETWRGAATGGERASGTAIYYLLRAGERSHWHRVDATEIWHHYGGARLALTISSDAGAPERLLRHSASAIKPLTSSRRDRLPQWPQRLL